MRTISFVQAINETLRYVMARNKKVVVLGEGVDDPIGTWGTTLGLKQRYGKERVIDMPLAENGATGIAIGLALAGFLPIAVHQRIDFLLLAMDEIVNHAAKWSYMFGGKLSIPLTIRCAIGMGWGMGGQHSQNLHSLFTHIPGLKVVMPATAYDAKGLLLSSILDPNPVIFIENYLLYKTTAPVPLRAYRIPLGKGIVRKEGRDATVVTFSVMVQRSLEAAQLLANDGIDLEVIDLRSLCPLDDRLIFNSVRKTGCLIIVEPGVLTCSFGAEISTQVQERLFPQLKLPVKRIAFPHSPAPASSALEKLYYPDAKAIAKIIRRYLKNKRIKERR